MIETIIIKIGKAILSKLIWIGIGVLLTLLLFATLCQPEPQTVTMEVPLQEIETILSSVNTLQTILDSDNWPKGYVIKTKYKTIYIDSATPYGDVPVVETSWDTTYELSINNELKRADMSIIITHKGEVFNHTIIFHPTIFKVDVPGEKSIRLCGSVGLGYLNQGSIYAPAEIGLMFKERVSLNGVAGYCNGWYVGGLLEAHF